MRGLFKISNVLLGFLVTPSLAMAFYNGSCGSQGEWVSEALSQSDSIRQAVERLKNDPNCTGIEAAVKVMSQDSDGKQNPVFLQSYSQLNREIRDLRMMSTEGSSGFKQRVTDILMNRVVSEADVANKSGQMLSHKDAQFNANSLTSLDQRVARALDTTFTGANEVLNILPNLQSCFNNRPNEAMAIFAALVRIGGAAIDGGEGVTSRAGGFLANLVSFARNNQYAKVLSQINEKQYWTSMSCLIETSAQAYCTAKDAYVILEDQKKLRIEEREKVLQGDESPLRGYYLLVREIPRVSDWLQRVLIGLPPQMNSQADFQKSVNNAYLGLLNDRLSLEGHYSQKLQTYRSAYGTDEKGSEQLLQAKRAFVITLLQEILQIMYSRGDEVNFFQMTVPDTVAPFVLLGTDMPEDLRKADAVMTWFKFLQVNMNDYPPLANPDEAMLRLKTNMDQLLETVMSTGALYFATWYIPDATRVVDEAVSIEPPNILQSLQNINKYLDQSMIRYLSGRKLKAATLENEITALEEQYAAGNQDVWRLLQRKKNLLEFYQDMTILPSLKDTRLRITKVLKVFEEREARIAESQSGAFDDFVTLKDDQQARDDFFLDMILKESQETTTPRKDLKAIDQEILQVAFSEFNVMLQRDTFLFNRFYNYIMSEYMERVQDNNEQDQYLRDLLTVTGRNLINRFVSINRLNPNSTSMDLSQAQPINLENLEALEKLFAKDLKVSICKITLRIGGTKEQTEACECVVNTNGEIDTPRLSSLGIRFCGSVRLKYGSDVDKSLKGDDEFKSYSQLKAKYCIQALAFPTLWEGFQKICEDTVLESQFSKEAELDQIKVNASFDSYASEFSSDDKTSDRICALRDYMRKNQVYWLLNKQTY